MVELVLAKDRVRVRFPLPAPQLDFPIFDRRIGGRHLKFSSLFLILRADFFFPACAEASAGRHFLSAHRWQRRFGTNYFISFSISSISFLTIISALSKSFLSCLIIFSSSPVSCRFVLVFSSSLI